MSERTGKTQTWRWFTGCFIGRRSKVKQTTPEGQKLATCSLVSLKLWLHAACPQHTDITWENNTQAEKHGKCILYLRTSGRPGDAESISLHLATKQEGRGLRQVQGFLALQSEFKASLSKLMKHNIIQYSTVQNYNRKISFSLHSVAQALQEME